MGNKLSTEEKNKNPFMGTLDIEVFLVKYNSVDERYIPLRITINNFDNEYKLYMDNNADSSILNKDSFILYNKITNNFNIIGETDESGKIINKNYIERVLGKK
jgi:hypothetical protein